MNPNNSEISNNSNTDIDMNNSNKFEEKKNEAKQLTFENIPTFIIDKKYYTIENLNQQEEEIQEDDIVSEVLFHKPNSKFKIEKNYTFYLNIRLDDWVKKLKNLTNIKKIEFLLEI